MKRFLANIKPKLRRGGSDGPVDDAAPDREGESGDTGMLVDYLAKIIGRPQYRDAVREAIRAWPQALDLLDVLTQAGDKIGEAEFPSVLAEWMKVAPPVRNSRILKLVFQNGAKSPWATREVLQSAATQTFRVAVDRDRTLSCMSFLVGEGADIEGQAYSGATALFYAARQGSVKAVEFLLAAKVDVNATGDGIWYPIHACFDNAKITRLLVAAGANVDILPTTTTTNPRPSLWFAVGWGFSAVVDELLKGNPSRETLQAGLKAAALFQKTNLVEKLLPYFPDASYLPVDFLHSQVKTSNLAMLERLLGRPYRMDPTKRDEDGDTALHCVLWGTSVKLVEMLIQHGADIEATNAKGETVLAVAVRMGNLEVARYLVQECKALVNVASRSRGSPFLEACHRGTLEMVKLLHGSENDPADVDRDTRGPLGTPLQAALLRVDGKATDKDDIIRYLIEEAHADINRASQFWGGALHLACLNASPETVRMLITRGADIWAEDYGVRTPLHFALYRTREHVDLLLERGADLDAVDVLGRNAMHCAVLSGRVDLVKFVREKRPQFVVGNSLICRTQLFLPRSIGGR